MNTKRNRWLLTAGQALIILLFSACTKNKLNSLLPQPASAVSNGSSIRLFNFMNVDADITVNNIPLTNYSGAASGQNIQGSQQGQATQIGLSAFPSGVWANQDGGSPFVIPTSLLDKQGKAHIQIYARLLNLGFNIPPIDTILQDDPLHPIDYYTLFDGTMKLVQRNAAAPSQPDHFKIRILNLVKSADQQGFYGPVTLTYADGTPVSPVTSGVHAPDSVYTGASDFIELPLGCYQLKVFMTLPGGGPDYTKQLAELPAQPDFNGYDQSVIGQPVQESVFPKIRTLKAGTTYSIVITRTTVTQSWADGGNNYTWLEQVNAYRLVTEQSGAANTTYACMDAVNALRLPDVSLSVDNTPLAANLPFGGYGGHKVLVWGSHHVQVIGQDGKVLAEKDIMMYPNDYLTAWVYLNPAGRPDIVFSTTDMTATLYQTNAQGNVVQGSGPAAVTVPDNGTDGSIRVTTTNYTWQSRFLNLSEDIPYVTFGNDNTGNANIGSANAGGDFLFPQPIYDGSDSVNFATATINLARGITSTRDPFVLFQLNSTSFFTSGHGTSSAPSDYPIVSGNQIVAFQSSPEPPALVPGTLLNLPGLSWGSFVANPQMYTTGYGPRVEPGFYSVALVGNAAQAAAGQAKLIYVKHNQ